MINLFMLIISFKIVVKFIFICYYHLLITFSLFYLGARHRKERLYHIDDTPSGVAEVIQDLDRTFQVNNFHGISK